MVGVVGKVAVRVVVKVEVVVVTSVDSARENCWLIGLIGIVGSLGSFVVEVKEF